MDAIVGARHLTPTAERVRRLMHYGQIMQSHALHFFHLCSPDLLFGFDSEVGKRNIVGVAEKHPETARRGVLIRKFGQEAIRITAGKRIHGTGSIPGGVNKSLSIEERDYLLKDAYQIVGWCRDAVHLARELHETDPALYNSFGIFRSHYMSLVGHGGAMDLYDGKLRARDDNGQIFFDGVEQTDYEKYIQEEVKPWSYMKFPYFKALGNEHGWYKVGPLARVQNCDSIPTPLADAERREFMDYAGETPMHAALAYHWTRMIEMLHAAETIKDLLHDPDILGSELMTTGERGYEGVGMIEAPRGTLIHHYQVDDNDLVTMCNLIVSTTHNNQAMNEAIRHVARRYLYGREITEGLLNHIEVAIRAYDPCLSCATHALGKMPLVVELREADGTLIHQLSRNA
jgi:NAD-reducing hydrogenase large subunit